MRPEDLSPPLQPGGIPSGGKTAEVLALAEKRGCGWQKIHRNQISSRSSICGGVAVGQNSLMNVAFGRADNR